MLICVPSLDMILKFCTVVTSALLQLLYLGGEGKPVHMID